MREFTTLIVTVFACAQLVAMTACSTTAPSWFTYMERARSVCAQGNFQMTEGLVAKALEEAKKFPGVPPKYQWMAPSSPMSLPGELASLAECYDYWGKHERAEALFKQAIAMAPPDDVLVYKSGLADFYGRNGKHRESEPLYKELFDSAERSLKKQDETTVDVRHSRILDLADCYLEEGRLLEAQTLYDSDIKALRNFPPGSISWNLVASLIASSKCHLRQGHSLQAKEDLNSALSVSLSTLKGADSSEVMTNLADLFVTEGDNTKAESFYKEALRKKEFSLHPETKITCQKHYADLLRRLGKLNEAKEADSVAEQMERSASYSLRGKPPQPYTVPLIYP